MSTVIEPEKDIVFENDRYIFHKILNYDNKFYYDFMVKYPYYWNLSAHDITDPKFSEAYKRFLPFLFVLDKYNDEVYGATLIDNEINRICVIDHKDVQIHDTMFFGLTEQEMVELFNK